MAGQTFYFYGGTHNHYYYPPALNPKKGGAMLYREDLMSERKDFSSVLPVIIDKLLFVGDSLNKDTVDVVGAVDGAARIVFEVAWELKAIDKALYGTPGELKEFIEKHF